jgi:hypothetical protein
MKEDNIYKSLLYFVMLLLQESMVLCVYATHPLRKSESSCVSCVQKAVLVLLRETISGRADDVKMGQKEVKSYKEISLFCDLNSIYSGIDLKLWNTKENNFLWYSKVTKISG